MRCFLGNLWVLFGTIVALLYRSNDMIIYASKKLLKRSAWVTYRRLLVNACCVFLLSLLGEILLPNVDTFFTFFICVIIYALVVGASVLIVNVMMERKIFYNLFKMYIIKNECKFK